MSYTGNVNVDVKSAYAQSFGALNDHTVYYSPKMGIDMRAELKALADAGMKIIQQKALLSTTGGAGTAGNALVPVYLDPRVVDQSRKYTPLVEMIPRVTNMGLTADYNKVLSKGSGLSLAEDAALNEPDDSYERASTAIKYLYRPGRVTGQAQAAIPSAILEGFSAQGSGLVGSSFNTQTAQNAKQLSVVLAAQALREWEENLIVNGSTSTDANQFSGIVTLQSTTNRTNKSSTAIQYDDVESCVQDAFDDSGRPQIAVASSSVLKNLRQIMIDTFNYRPSDMTTQLPFGVSSHLTLETMVGPVPVIPSQYLSNTSGSKSIYFLDPDYVEMRVLQDMTYQDLGKTNDSDKFFLKIYECLLMRNTNFNSFIANIL